MYLKKNVLFLTAIEYNNFFLSKWHADYDNT